MRARSGSWRGIAGCERHRRVGVMYGLFGGSTVHGDVAYSTPICPLYYLLLI